MRPATPPTAAPTVPVYPALGSANFNQESYIFGSSMQGVSIDLGTLAANVAQNADIAFENAGDANLAANAAAASQAQTALLAASAAQSVGAQRWQPIPKYYNGGEVVWSPVNGQTYRCSAPEGAAFGSYDDPSSASEAGNWWLIGAALSPPIEFVTVDTVARPGVHYVILAPVKLTLPSPAALRDIVWITDLSGSMAATVDPGGAKIRGQLGTMQLNLPRAQFQLVYSGNEKGWI